MKQIVQSILWRRLDGSGHDACTLRRLADGWRLAGAAVFADAGRPCCLTYAVECHTDWQTRAAQVTGWIGGDTLSFTFTTLPGLRWQMNGIEQEQVTGCTEVDFSFTPATNLIALRRMALPIGEEAATTAAWFIFPDMTLAPLQQRYRRVDACHYAYCAEVGYTGTLAVSDAGFITHYPGLWEAVARHA